MAFERHEGQLHGKQLSLEQSKIVRELAESISELWRFYPNPEHFVSKIIPLLAACVVAAETSGFEDGWQRALRVNIVCDSLG